MKDGLVSVIVPIYNAASYLNQCIESIINQSYKNLEILLIDDGSTDTSLKTCQEFMEKDSRIKIFQYKNQGIGATRNLGIDIASGDYIIFVDADDYIESDCIMNLYDTLIKTQSDIAIGNFYKFVQNTGTFLFHLGDSPSFIKTYTPKEWFQNEYNDDKLFEIVFTVPWGKLYKKKLFKNVHYPENKLTDDDYTTWKLYLMATKISYSNVELYCYRIREQSNTHSISMAERLPLDSIEERLTLLTLLGFSTADIKKVYTKRLEWLKDYFLHDSKLKQYHDVCFKLECIKKFNKE